MVIEFIFNLLETTQVRTIGGRGGGGGFRTGGGSPGSYQDRGSGHQDRGRRKVCVVIRTGGGSPGKCVWSSGQGEWSSRQGVWSSGQGEWSVELSEWSLCGKMILSAGVGIRQYLQCRCATR